MKNEEELSYLERHFLFTKAWWKLDDKGWIAQRKLEWKRVKTSGMILHGAVGNPFPQAGRFYVYGEETSKEDAARGNRPTVTIGGKDRLLLTPVETAEQVSLLYNKLGTAHAKEDNWKHLLSSACKAFDGLADSRDRVSLLAKGVFGSEFRVIVAPHSDWNGRATGGEVEVTRARPYWAELFFGEAYSSLAKRLPRRIHSAEPPRTYSFAVDCIEYCVSLLRYMEDQGELLSEIGAMKFRQVIDLLTNKPKSIIYEPWQQELADKLLAAFEAPDAPRILKEALKKS